VLVHRRARRVHLVVDHDDHDDHDDVDDPVTVAVTVVARTPPGPNAGPILVEVDDLLVPARELADAIVAALPGWVERCVDRAHRAEIGAPPTDVVAAARVAGAAAAADIGARVRALLEADIDDQRTTPLALVRQAVSYPTEVLLAAGVPPARRDSVARAMFPEDVYGLSPASFADLSPRLSDLAITWGAAKAWVHRRRHAP
jgi:hypothetical protein